MKEKLNIATISPTYIPTPPLFYGGIERVNWDLSVGLAELGHRVTLVAPKGSGSTPKVKLFETVDARQNFADEQPAYDLYKKTLGDYSCVVDHSHIKFAYLNKTNNDSSLPDPKLIGVLHTHPSWRTPPRKDGVNIKACFTAVSNHHANMYSGILGVPIMTTYNGVNTNTFAFKKEKSNRFLWVGRFEPFKSPHIAVYLAKKLGFNLDLIGKISDSPKQYVQSVFKDMEGSPNIRYLGEVDEKTLIEAYRDAKALFMIPMWDEPMGLTQIEAQSCGTPIIGTTMGAMNETMVHGETGFLANNVEEMAEYVGRIDEIDAVRCREFVKSKFSRQVMAKRYEELAYRVCGGDVW